MRSQNSKLDLTLLILAILVLQVILSAGLLLRVNQIYRWTLESEAATSAHVTDTSLTEGVSPDDDPFIGPADAPVTIVEFSDFACGHCRETQETLARIRDAYGDQVRVVFRDFPLEGVGSASFTAALAAECADDQGAFWAMHDLLFENQPVFDRGSLRSYATGLGLDMEQFDNCLESEEHQAEVMHDVEDGRSYGVAATPTFFVNGRRLVGTVSFSIFQRAIGETLQER